MSVMASKVHCILDELFPANPHRRVFPEYFVSYKGTKLFFDFYVKEYFVFIECQGRQHTQFVKHFHGDGEAFSRQKMRDNLKLEYVQKNGLYLVRIYDHEEITKDLVLCKIHKALDDEYSCCDQIFSSERKK